MIEEPEAKDPQFDWVKISLFFLVLMSIIWLHNNPKSPITAWLTDLLASHGRHF